MWIVVNNQDLTQYIRPDKMKLDMALSDPLTTFSFDVVDTGSNLNLAFNQNVMVWDENASPDFGLSGIAHQHMPTVNVAIDPSFSNPTITYTKGGTYSANITYGFGALMTFSNVALTGSTHDAHITQTATSLAEGYITAGQKYMFSVYLDSNSTTPVNLQYYFQINWLDANQNLLSSVTSTPATPPTSTTRKSISAIAPANAVYAQSQCGVYATSTTNSGTVQFSTLQIEPMWYPNAILGNGTIVTYPTIDCNYNQLSSILMPDGTTARINRLFYGYITNIEATYEGTKRTWTVDCRYMGDVIDNGGTNTPIDVTYTSFTDVQIITDLITNHYAGVLSTGQANISMPSTTLVTGATIDSISFTDQTFREVLNNITDITGYVYYIDAYMYLHYNPIPYTYSNFTLLSSTTAQPDYVNTFPPIEYTYIQDGTQIRNSVKVIGGNFQTTVQDVFSGTGSNKVFSLSQIPVSIISISTNGGTSNFAPTSANKIGVQGQNTNGSGGVVALMDSNNKKVTFNTAPASGTSNVIISYTQNTAVCLLVEENISIGLYRRFVAKVTDSSLTSNNAGVVRGESEISQWGYPVQNITFKLSSQMGASWQPINMFLTPGTTILFTSTLDNLTSQPFVIQTVSVTSLGGGVNIYEYEAGVYRPTMNDLMRNVQKSLARNPSTGGSTPVQLTFEVLREQMMYVDSVQTTAAPSTGVFKYNTAVYGFASYS